MVVIALATLAGGLLIIRVCGEQRLQSLIDMAFWKKTVPDKAMVASDHHLTVVSDENHLS